MHAERAYFTRMLLCLAAALLVPISVLHIPLHAPPDRVGWNVRSGVPLLPIDYDKSQTEERQKSVAPATLFALPTERHGVKQGTDSTAGKVEERQRESPAPARLAVRRTLVEQPDNQPQIVGGLGSYYVHIEYPEEAIRREIEGRLILRFVVEEDGKPTNIELHKPLHPLCDSAAVQALRKTLFAPGRKDGKAVAVRMVLPVRFKLVNPPERPRTQDTADASTTS